MLNMGFMKHVSFSCSSLSSLGKIAPAHSCTPLAATKAVFYTSK